MIGSDHLPEHRLPCHWNRRHRRLVSLPTRRTVRQTAPDYLGRTVRPFIAHAAPTLLSLIYEALPRLVSPIVASQCLMVGQQRLAVSPTQHLRPPLH
jgi:hypothetical protein